MKVANFLQKLIKKFLQMISWTENLLSAWMVTFPCLWVGGSRCRHCNNGRIVGWNWRRWMTRRMLRLNHERKTSVSIDLRVFLLYSPYKAEILSQSSTGCRCDFTANQNRLTHFGGSLLSSKLPSAGVCVAYGYGAVFAICRLRFSRCFRDLDKQFSLWTPSKLITMRTD